MNVKKAQTTVMKTPRVSTNQGLIDVDVMMVTQAMVVNAQVTGGGVDGILLDHNNECNNSICYVYFM